MLLRKRVVGPHGLARLSALVASGLAVICLLSAAAPCLARPPAKPDGPVAPSRGGTGALSGLPLGIIPLKVYAAAVAFIFGGAALFAFVSLRREARERGELLGLAELNLLGQHAEAIAVLYERYCKRFPARRPLWEACAADERKHSRWIGEFPARIRGGEGSLRRDLFPYGRVASAIDQVQQLARDAEHPDLTEGTALRNALLQERERAEWRLPDLFAVSSGKFGTTLELIQSETQAHQQALTGAIGEC